MQRKFASFKHILFPDTGWPAIHNQSDLQFLLSMKQECDVTF